MCAEANKPPQRLCEQMEGAAGRMAVLKGLGEPTRKTQFRTQVCAEVTESWGRQDRLSSLMMLEVTLDIRGKRAACTKPFHFRTGLAETSSASSL